MRKPLLLGLWFIALTACADEPTNPLATGVRPTASVAADADWGEADVAAQWAAFEATPGTRPGVNVVEAALADVLRNAPAATTLEVIVSFDPTVTTGAAVASRLHSLGAGTIGFKHLPMVYAIATPAAISTIAAAPGVESVYRNRQLEYALYESTKAIRADLAWTWNGTGQGFTGRGVGVAILDSGIDGLYNPGLTYPTKTVRNVKYIANLADVVTFSDNAPVRPAATLFVDNVANSETSVGHGTHVAGIAAGNGAGSTAGIYRGVAPDANLIGIGAGDILFIFWVLAGFDYVLDNAAAHNIKVVNNSWGITGAFDPNDPVNKATRAVYDGGITVVFAAGNEGPGENTMNPYSVPPWVISVAAGCKLGVQDPTNSVAHCADQTPANREPVLADFSSRGIPGDGMYHPDITAPGVHIVSTRASTGTVMNALDLNHDANICNIAVQHVGLFTCASGTSMAAPHVAGAVAVIQEAAGGRLTPNQVLGILRKSAGPLRGYAEFEVGSGYLDVYGAARRARR
ncbi:MAG: S8 family serine peptidase [Gemmatimonadaceae bacterium]